MRASADLELARRMLAGDERAFETFGERYPKALYRFALARLDGDRDLTRDLVQTAICKALARLETYRGEASLLTWLCACCRNEILMHLRAKRTTPDEGELEDDTRPAVGFGDPGPGNPEARVLRLETGTLVHMALDVLPERYAVALESKYLEHLPVREIAARLGMGTKATESLLTRARQAFKAAYEDLRGERHVLAAGEVRRRRRNRNHG